MKNWIRFLVVVTAVLLAGGGVSYGQLTTTPFTRQILTNSSAGQARTNLGITISDVSFTNANTLYLRKDGSDASARIGRADLAWAGPSNAFVALPNNHQLLIGPGDFGGLKGYVAHQVGGYATLKLFSLTNVHIRGAGSGTTLRYTNYGTCIYMSNCNNVTISDLNIIGLPPTATGIDLVLTNFHAVIEVEQSTNCVFERLYIKDHGNQGVWNYGSGAFSQQSYNCIVRDCSFINLGSWTLGGTRYDGAAVVCGAGWTVERNYIEGCARGIEPFAKWGGFAPCRVNNNKIYNSMDHAIAFGGEAGGTTAYGYFTGGEIIGNTIVYEPGYQRLGSNSVPDTQAIFIHNASNVTCRANNIYGAPNGILVATVSASNIVNTVVDDNVILKSIVGITLQTDQAHVNQHILNSTVRGNFIGDSATYAINLWSPKNILIENNFIHNWGLASAGAYEAIRVYGNYNPSNILIFNNRIIDTQPTHTGGYGIWIHPGSKAIRMGGNVVVGQTSFAITNEVGAEVLYDDYARILAGTNLFVGDHFFAAKSGASWYMTNGLFANNAYVGPLSLGSTIAAWGHKAAIEAGPQYTALCQTINASITYLNTGENINIQRGGVTHSTIDDTDNWNIGSFTPGGFKLSVTGNSRTTQTNFSSSVVATNGVWTFTNSPPAVAIAAGASFIWNSNGVATFILTSSTAGTAWVSTNRLGGP